MEVYGRHAPAALPQPTKKKLIRTEWESGTVHPIAKSLHGRRYFLATLHVTRG
jgi:hypothetical protein